MQTDQHKGLHLKERFTQAVLSRFGVDANQIAMPNGTLSADVANSVLYLSLVQTKPGRRVDQPMLAFLLALKDPGRSYGDLDEEPIQLARTIAKHCACGGKAIVIVSDGTLSTDVLCAGRAALVQSGMLQEVTYLPQGCFADSMIGGAALLLTQNNCRIAFSSTSTAHELKDRAKEVDISELLGGADGDGAPGPQPHLRAARPASKRLPPAAGLRHQRGIQRKPRCAPHLDQLPHRCALC